MCPYDNKFYQTCGHHSDKCGFIHQIYNDGNELFCGKYICDSIIYSDSIYSGDVDIYFNCNNIFDCYNTDLDEAFCTNLTNNTYQCRDTRVSKTINFNKLCDLNCDCWACDDEGHCNNVIYGVYCTRKDSEYLSAAYYCDNYKNCYNGEDEILCDSELAIRECEPGDYFITLLGRFKPNEKRKLFPNQICAVPYYKNNFYYTCSDGLDQINCTDDSRVALTCTMNNYICNMQKFPSL